MIRWLKNFLLGLSIGRDRRRRSKAYRKAKAVSAGEANLYRNIITPQDGARMQ